MSIIKACDGDIRTKSVNDGIGDVIDENKSDISHFAAIHRKGVICVMVYIEDGLICFQTFAFSNHNAHFCHFIHAEVLNLRRVIGK